MLGNRWWWTWEQWVSVCCERRRLDYLYPCLCLVIWRLCWNLEYLMMASWFVAVGGMDGDIWLRHWSGMDVNRVDSCTASMLYTMLLPEGKVEGAARFSLLLDPTPSRAASHTFRHVRETHHPFQQASAQECLNQSSLLNVAHLMQIFSSVWRSKSTSYQFEAQSYHSSEWVCHV